MTDIASSPRGATTGLVYDLRHISRLVLHQIGEEYRMVDYNQEASTSHGPSIRPLVSSTSVGMQPIRGRGRGRVNRPGHGRDGGRGHGRDGEEGRGTLEPTLHTPPHTYPSPITRYFHTSPFLPITQYLYTPTDLHITFHTPHTYTSLPSSVLP